jgi:hypothetical protein
LVTYMKAVKIPKCYSAVAGRWGKIIVYFHNLAPN